MSMNALGRTDANTLSKSWLEVELLKILGDYVSQINARSMVSRAIANSCENNREKLDQGTLFRVLARVEAAVLLFINPAQRNELKSRLEELKQQHGGSVSTAERIAVKLESDIVVARTKARMLCDDLGARNVASHKVATIVSELARNIVSYTPGGRIELIPAEHGRAIIIRAEDNGPGISNLEEILAGRYRSKTGLGLGLAGSRRLAQEFDIKTGPTGTRIELTITF